MIWIFLMFNSLKGRNHIKLKIENSFCNWKRMFRNYSFWIHIKEREIIAEVKNVETLFRIIILTFCWDRLWFFFLRTESWSIWGKNFIVFADTSSSANHLPEFNWRTNTLKEYKVQYFRNINTCIKHINTDGNYRLFIWYLEIFNDCTGIINRIINKLTIIISFLRIKILEPFNNFQSMFMIYCKKNGLSKFFSTFCFKTFIHQCVKNKIQCWKIYYIFIEFIMWDSYRCNAVFSELILVFLFFIIRKFRIF